MPDEAGSQRDASVTTERIVGQQKRLWINQTVVYLDPINVSVGPGGFREWVSWLRLEWCKSNELTPAAT